MATILELVCVRLRLSAAALLLILSGVAGAADDPAARALQQNQLLRQQQQDQMQLRMQQYQHSVQNPPGDARQGQVLEQLELDQALRQQQLQMQQQRALQTRPDIPSEDPGTRAAKAQIDQARARQESQRQLQQFDWELQSAAQQRRRAEPLPNLPGTPDPRPGALRLPLR